MDPHRGRAADLVIDSHQHFWDPRTHQLSRLTGGYSALRRPFLPTDLEPILRSTGVSRSVAVQADDTLDDTLGLLVLCNDHPFLAGVVGWIDPDSSDPEFALRSLLAAPGAANLVGIRMNARDRADPDWLSGARPTGAALCILQRGLVCELVLRSANVGSMMRLVEAANMGTFVIDHLMTVPIRRSERTPWQRAVKALAQHPDIYLKVSGFMHDPGPDAWKPAAFHFAIDYVLETWPIEKLMFGTDWPVCTLVQPYTAMVEWTFSALSGLSDDERSLVVGENCARCYGLSL